jgi:hypothetical protein
MTQRKLPPKIKIYEALWSIADGRIKISSLLENEGKCYSSSGNKYYIIKYDEATNAIMTNDNGSYWKWYLWYPAIAFLMKKWIITYNEAYSQLLKGIARKDINQKFDNDFDKTIEYILDMLLVNAIDKKSFLQEIDHIYHYIEQLNLNMLWKKIQPPTGY